MRSKLVSTVILACTLTACTPFQPSATTPAPSPTVQVTSLPAKTAALPGPTDSPQPSPSATRLTPTVTPPVYSSLCSPLDGVALPELSQPDMLKNAFDPPAPGEDGGHMGVDFAYWSRDERKTMLGHPVLSVLNGQVAAAMPLRQPYGYAVIIETRLSALPPGWLSAAPVPTPAPTTRPSTRLYCPTGSEVDALSVSAAAARFPEDYSLYLLYAHLDQATPVTLGQPVACGQEIGAAGTTGNSVNIHLHLETRLGPSGAAFTSLGHYENNLTDLEMSNYCAWRVSGLFQTFDPLHLLSIQP